MWGGKQRKQQILFTVRPADCWSDSVVVWSAESDTVQHFVRIARHLSRLPARYLHLSGIIPGS